MSAVKQFIDNAVANKSMPAAGAIIINDKGEITLSEFAGVTNAQDENPSKFDADTSTTLASCTKLITSIAALQLLEQGKISLDDPVERYIPAISKFQQLERGPRDGGKPTYRTAKSKPTILHLMTHTSGLAYDWFEADNLACSIAQGRSPAAYYSEATPEAFEAPFIFEPGSKYIYGTSTDFLGEVVQAVSGIRLIDYCHKNIFEPLDMKNTFAKERLNPNANRMHTHINQGVLIAIPDILAEKGTFGGGGGFLNSSMNDFARLLATILNGGVSPHNQARILKGETVSKYLLADCLTEAVDRSKIGKIDAAIPPATNTGDLMSSIPESKRGVSCAGLLVNHDDLVTGRKKGSAFWCGFMNVYYWLDPVSKLAGVAGTNMLPFMYQPALELFDLVERTAYGLEGSQPMQNFALAG